MPAKVYYDDDADLSLLRAFDGHKLHFSEREDVLMKIGQASEKASSVLLHLDTLELPPVSLTLTKKPGRRQQKKSVRFSRGYSKSSANRPRGDNCQCELLSRV